MGEVVVSSEGGGGGMELEVLETEAVNYNKEEVDGSATVVRWEKFLPRIVLRVLLVEADDSTRQIIAALLRKCSYKVTAVSDGLKAWEVLKGRPHNIDLILTEVELPSIAGFALLTLITEHEICKNIPVIMMSAHDSVSTVYKCMLRGAADFLVKPVRKNELKNLWQHVWRRQASTSSGPPDASDAQQKVEATAENNANSNHSSGYMACLEKNRECIEKGTDAQSSCTKPELEAEGADREHRQDHLQPKHRKSLSSEVKCVGGSEQLPMHANEAGGSAAFANSDTNRTTLGGDIAPDSQMDFADVTTEACGNNNVIVNPYREAIDLIGAFDNYAKCGDRSSGLTYYEANNVDSSYLLDLSLRRSHPSGSVNQIMDEGHKLKHSDASAFSRYVSRTFPPLNSISASICDQQRAHESNSDKRPYNQVLDYDSDTHGPTMISSENNMISLTTRQPLQSEIQLPCRQQRVIPVPVPVRGIRFESLCNSYGSVMPPMFSTQSSPGSSGLQEPSCQVNQTFAFNPETRNNPQQLHYLMDQNTCNATDLPGHKLDPLEEATDQSGSTSFCNVTLSRFNSINSGSNGNCNANPVPVGQAAAAECGNEATISHDNNCHRSIQREAALTKFRMKRKDRCYEKKVRYESRKKLAEQRPRVKGQFVRQTHTEVPSVETDNLGVN